MPYFVNADVIDVQANLLVCYIYPFGITIHLTTRYFSTRSQTIKYRPSSKVYGFEINGQL
jgi:hypothetical protein